MLIRADARQIPLADNSIHCCVTSPPYWRLRRYCAGEIGQELTPQEYVLELVEAFREVGRVMVDSGVLWLNLGDSYAVSGKGGGGSKARPCWNGIRQQKGFRMPPPGWKMKDLMLMPLHVANTLRADGWTLRQTVIWSRTFAVEPKRLDRPSTSHEYLFQLTKSQHGSARDPGEPWWAESVWRIGVDAKRSKHPATMPLELARRCIVCSTQPGDIVLDPFCGSGTTALAARRLGRRSIGIDLSPEYIAIAADRLRCPVTS
jgi:DNA modification methylase